MTRRFYSNTATQALLAADVTATTTVLTFTPGTYGGYPPVPFTAALERGTPQEEIVLVTASMPGSVTVVRGYDGTTPTSHASGAGFLHVVVAMDYDEASAHRAATSGVHGVAGDVVGTTDTQTLTSKTLAAAALTGTTTGQNLALSGTLSVTGATSLVGVLSAAAGTFAGALSAAGGLTVPTGQKATLADAPTAGTDGVNKTYADALGTPAATASTIARRDAAGRLQLATPAVAADAATLGWTLGLGSWRGDATAHPGTPIAGDRYRRTNLGNTVFQYSGSAWRQVDPAVVADAAARTALPATDLHPSFVVLETATGLRWQWNGTAWQPLDAVYGKLWRTAGVSAVIAQNTDTPISFNVSRVTGGFATAPDVLILPLDGIYDLDACTYWAGSGAWYATSFINRIRSATANLSVAAADVHLHAGTIDARSHFGNKRIPLKAGDQLQLSAYNYTGGAADARISGVNEASGCYLSARYVGPLNGATPL